MATTKLSPELSARLEAAADDEPVDLVLELRSGAPSAGSREAMVESARQDFARSAGPVEAEIARLGGEVTGRAWLNQTVRATVPAAGVRALARLREVVSVDIPALLRRAVAG